MSAFEEGGARQIPLQVSRGCVVASIQVDLSDEVLRRFRVELLKLLHVSGVTSVILDVSGVDVMDGEDFGALRRTMAMAELMGARCILAGLRPGVVSSLVEIVADLDEVESVLNIDEAFEQLTRPRPDPDGPAYGAAVRLDDERAFPWVAGASADESDPDQD